MRVVIAMTCVLALAACGGSRGGGTVTRANLSGATGQISRACVAADRAAATVPLCSCVQSVANAELSSTDQRRIARFFADPEFAHEIRISDTDADDAFWRRYQAYVERARNTCG